MNAPDTALEIKAAITAVIAFGTALFGWVGWVLIIWVVSVLADYITGTWAAMSKGEWSSKKAREGLWHKLGSIAAIFVAALCDLAISAVLIGAENYSITIGVDNVNLLTPLVALWYTFTELGSIIENAHTLGAPIPEWLSKTIEKCKQSTDNKMK